MPGQGLLMVMTDIDPELEGDFNRWYDEEHVPHLLAVPGFLEARRYRILQGQPKYLAVYDLAKVSVLDSPEYLRARAWGPDAAPAARQMLSNFRNPTRAIYQHVLTLPTSEPTGLSRAQALLIAGLEVHPAHEEEFQEWYNTEHLPNLSAVPGVVRARRYRLCKERADLAVDLITYVALYDLERPDVPASEQWQRGRNTPWSARILRFSTLRRNLYERMA